MLIMFLFCILLVVLLLLIVYAFRISKQGTKSKIKPSRKGALQIPIYEGKEKYIFVSYSHKDSHIVLPIIEALSKSGFRVWFDGGIQAGTEWPAYIEEHLNRASCVLVCMSPSAVNSVNCRNEINYACMLKKDMLVVYLEETDLKLGLNLQLNSQQSLFKYRHKSTETFIEQLLISDILLPCKNTNDDDIHKTISSATSTEKTEFRKNRKIVTVLLSIIVIVISVFLVGNISLKDKSYNNAILLMHDEKYEDAIIIFDALNGYRDSNDKKKDCTIAINEKEYIKVSALIKEKKYTEAIPLLKSLDKYKDSRFKLSLIYGILNSNKNIGAGDVHTVALNNNGTLYVAGANTNNQCNVHEWRDVIAIASGAFHTVGLKSDGTIVAAGRDIDDALLWSNIKSISAGFGHTVGIKNDGTVVVTGNEDVQQYDLSNWKDIVDVSVGYKHIVGIKPDGTVTTAGDTALGQCDVSDWKDIVAVSAGLMHTIGLRSNGTVVAVGTNSSGQCNVSEWTDIVAISTGDEHTVALKANGTVVAVGNNENGQCNVSDWKDIIAISTSRSHTVGLKSDGTVIATGDNLYTQCNISHWDNVKINLET